MIDVPTADWQFVIGVNIWGIIHGIRHFVPAILRHGEEGHVVNTASVAGFQNRRGTDQGPYSMSKYAALSLIRTKTFYAFVSAVPADVIRARHRRIEEALNSAWVTHY
jgi:NAD(P)-dependent dehydrogenase (short-subunit alcohol dehydrogenase family)